MSRYRTPLPRWLAGAIEYTLNRAVELDEQGVGRVRPLMGRWLKFELSGIEIDLWFSATEDGLLVQAEPPTAEGDTPVAPDTFVQGTPGALMGMAIPELDGPGTVKIEGDARLAQQFQHVLKGLEPDWEAGISQRLGPVLGPQVYRMLVDASRFGRHAAVTTGDQVGHWLRNESGSVPNQEEWVHWRDQVDQLREAVDRLDSRMRRLGKA
ncbi:MAG: SCP2 sterol-binding domain-containing protein [Pseudomonadota bacterium]